MNKAAASAGKGTSALNLARLPDVTNMTNLTTLDELKRHITLLASVDISDAPFISVYLNLEHELAGWQETIDTRARTLRRILKDDDLADFEEALGKIES